MRECLLLGRVKKVARMRISFSLILGFLLQTSAVAQTELTRGEILNGHLDAVRIRFNSKRRQVGDTRFVFHLRMTSLAIIRFHCNESKLSP